MSAAWVEPPPGWLAFGSLIEYAGLSECSDETGEDGLPLWERPLPLASLAERGHRMTDDASSTSALDDLNAAVSTFANHDAEQPTIVDVALVIWEQVTFDDDGEMGRRIRYAVPTDNFSLSSGLGLIEAAGEYVRRDILAVRTDDDDD